MFLRGSWSNSELGTKQYTWLFKAKMENITNKFIGLFIGLTLNSNRRIVIKIYIYFKIAWVLKPSHIVK
jgi:hypothetical protein